MANYSHELDDALVAAGWTRSRAPGNQGASDLDGQYESTWGVLGVIVCENAAAADSRWPRAQARLATLKSEAELGFWMDYYLFVLVEAVEPQDWPTLRAIVSDTHVCRKICEELGHATVEHIVRQSPVLNLHWATVPAAIAAEPLARQSSGIPRKLSDDLTRRRADVILNRLLAGIYDEEGEHEA